MNIKLRLFVYNRVMTILRMCEWTTGKTEVLLFHIDGKLNLADLLTKQCELSVKSITLDSECQTGLPWMRLDTESMPLLVYDQLRVEQLIEDEVRVECYDDAMTGEFSQLEENSVLLAHDQLRVEKPSEDEVRVEYSNNAIMREFSQVEESSVHLSNSVLFLAAGLARVQVNLLVDPVLHGWTKTLRLINYLLALPKRLKHKLHLIPDKKCQICDAGDNKWDLTVIEQNAEKSLFRYETRGLKSV